jgi:hypothetical protein
MKEKQLPETSNLLLLPRYYLVFWEVKHVMLPKRSLFASSFCLRQCMMANNTAYLISLLKGG